MQDATKKRLGFIAAFAVYFVALWMLWYTPIIFPLKVFVVMLHEISHGLVTLATGGTIESIVVTPAEGGLCKCGGGNAFLTLSAGYLGSLAWGALIFWAAVRKGAWSRGMTAAIGIFLLGISLMFVRNPFGLGFGLLFGAGLVMSARYLGVATNGVILMVLGLTSVLYAILDIKSDVLDRPNLPSDARMLSELTAVPTVVWGVMWIGIALLVAWWLLRWAYRRI